MLISHRQSAYVDNDGMELAAGMAEIRAKEAVTGAEHFAWAGVACALRAIQRNDVKDAEDLLTIVGAAIGEVI